MRAPDFTHSAGANAGALKSQALSASHIISCSLPHLQLADRLLLRAAALLASRYVAAVHGTQHVRPTADPFILVANHSSRRDALLVPAVLLLHRGGRPVHFLADWNFRLIPGIGCLYARAQVVTVTRKSAKPRYLNALKPLYATSKSPLEQARARLATGLSLGIFPEGKVNPNPTHLLRGRHGAARLSLESGVPVVPMGIRFTSGQPEHLIGAGKGMELHIGAPLAPPEPALPRATLRAVTAWHAVIMTEIARLSGKTWLPDTKEAHNAQ